MKLGFIAANDLGALEADARFAVEHGFQGLEFNYWQPFDDLTAETVAGMREILDRHGLACSSFGLWGRNHLAPDPQERAAAHDALRRAIEFAKTIGAEVLTTGGGQLSPDDLTAETVAGMREILDRHGLACSSFGLWGRNHLSPDPQERAAAHDALRRAIEFAKTLGAEVLTTGGGQFSPDDQDANIEEFAKVFPPFVEEATKAGMRVAIYPVHGGSFFRSVADYERVWEKGLDVGIKFDPANWRHAGLDYLAALRDHADKVAHVHIKEHLYLDGKLASQPAAGMGDIEWGKVMAFLYEANYDGYLSIEPHGPKWSRPPLREKMLLLTRRHIAQFLL